MLVSDLSAGELLIINAADRSKQTRLPVGRMPTGILISPDGVHAFVACSGDNHIAVVDLKSVRLVRMIATGNSPDGMAFITRGGWRPYSPDAPIVDED